MELVIDNETQKEIPLERRVFDYWKLVMNKPRAKINAKRKKVIKDRIKEGYEWEDFEAAINGCRKSSFHMGGNQNGKVYNDIELICRDGCKLESFAEHKSFQEQVIERVTDNSWADGM